MRAQEERVRHWEMIRRQHRAQQTWPVGATVYPILLDLPQDRSTAHTCDFLPPTRDAQPRIWVAKFPCVFKNEPPSQTSTFRLRFITWTEPVRGQLSGRAPQPGPSSHSGLRENFRYCPPDLPSLPGEHSLVRWSPTILFLEGQRLSSLT